METAPEPLLGFDFEKTNLCALKRVHRAQKHTTMGLSYLTAPKACNKTLFALSIISRPRKIYKKKKSHQERNQTTRSGPGTSSDPSAQSNSPLHFKDAEMQPPLAHTYSLEEQVGEAGCKHIFQH